MAVTAKKVYSPWTDVIVVGYTLANWYLRDYNNQATNFLAFHVHGRSFHIRSKTVHGVFNPVGASRSVVVQDIPKGDDITIVMDLDSDNDYQKARQLLDLSPGPLVLQSVYGESWIVRPTTDPDIEIIATEPVWRHVTVTFSEVAV